MTRANPDRRAQWLKGVLDLCVLGVLATGDAYGYELAQRLEGAGLGEMKGGTLYPALTRLDEEGSVTASWRPSERGPDRKYYAITETGRTRLDTEAAQWAAFVDAARLIINKKEVQS
jgi:PadR family transcriptional regulator PadR